MSFEEALHKERNTYRAKDDLHGATVYLPSWIRESVSLIRMKRDISERVIYTAMVVHGAAIIRNKYDSDIGAVKDLRIKLLESNNTMIRGFVGNYDIGLDTVSGLKRRSLRLADWSNSYLTQLASDLNIEKSSMLRLAMYHSIVDSKDITDDYKRLCSEEINKFEQRLKDYLEMLQKLAT